MLSFLKNLDPDDEVKVRNGYIVLPIVVFLFHYRAMKNSSCPSWSAYIRNILISDFQYSNSNSFDEEDQDCGDY